MLGISAHTLRRRIQAGEIHAERIERATGLPVAGLPAAGAGPGGRSGAMLRALPASTGPPARYNSLGQGAPVVWLDCLRQATSRTDVEHLP
jgi:hypothetical protein